MSSNWKRLVAIIVLVSFSQYGCYNTYFITKDELEKLESDVETQRVVEVQADCPTDSGMAKGDDGSLDGTEWVEAETGQTDQATDAVNKATADSSGDCTSVPVSTSNAINVVMNEGSEHRVTPFNFMMSERQIISPEYDLLVSLDEVEGAEVREFSTWKTVMTITGVTAAAVGTFVGISILAPEGGGFSN